MLDSRGGKVWLIRWIHTPEIGDSNSSPATGSVAQLAEQMALNH